MSYTDEELQAKELELMAALEEDDFIEQHTTPDSHFPVGLSIADMIDAALAKAENDEQ